MITPKVTAIVPGHDSSGTLGACLSSLRSQDWPKDCIEIVYVDDASTDASVKIASECADRIVRLMGFPRGPAAARNSGALESSGEILFFLDSDVVAPPGTIRALVEPLLEDEKVDAVFGSYDSEPFERSLVSQYRNLLHHIVHQSSRPNAATFWAGCGAIRKRSFELTGGFDAARYQGAMIEDIEIGHRMRALGMQIRLRRSVQVKHLKKWTLFNLLYADIFSRGIPWMRLMFQDSRPSGEIGDLNLKLSGIVSVVLAWLGVLLLLFSIRSPKLFYGASLALGIGFVINLPTYRFFWTIRGLQFTVLITPLHFLYHLYNGVSVLAALLYRILIDNPLPGFKSLGAVLQQWYWRRLGKQRPPTDDSRRSYRAP